MQGVPAIGASTLHGHSPEPPASLSPSAERMAVSAIRRLTADSETAAPVPPPPVELEEQPAGGALLPAALTGGVLESATSSVDDAVATDAALVAVNAAALPPVDQLRQVEPLVDPAGRSVAVAGADVADTSNGVSRN